MISCYGIIYNRDALRRLGFAGSRRRNGTTWPTRGSWARSPSAIRPRAARSPWRSRTSSSSRCSAAGRLRRVRAARPRPCGRRAGSTGCGSIQRIGANARYFTDSSQKPPIDVADGDCAVGHVHRLLRPRAGGGACGAGGDPDRLGFAVPGGRHGLLRRPDRAFAGRPARVGGPGLHRVRPLARRARSSGPSGPGSPGGPRDFALRRLPVRRDFYGRGRTGARCAVGSRSRPLRGKASRLVYRPEWTRPAFGPLAFIDPGHVPGHPRRRWRPRGASASAGTRAGPRTGAGGPPGPRPPSTMTAPGGRSPGAGIGRPGRRGPAWARSWRTGSGAGTRSPGRSPEGRDRP